MVPKKGMSPTSDAPKGGSSGKGGTIDTDNPVLSGDIETDDTCTEIIKHIIYLGGFTEDSVMVKYMKQQEWKVLFHVTTLHFDEIKDFETVRDDGRFEASPLKTHCRILKCFFLYYKKKCSDLSTTLAEEDVLDFKKTLFEEYCSSADCYRDREAAEGLISTTPRLVKSDPGIVDSFAGLTGQEFRRGVKRDKTHYEDLKDDKYFNSWNRGFVATAHMHHTHLVLDENYVPKNDTERDVFKEMQIFIYAVLEEHLKTSKG